MVGRRVKPIYRHQYYASFPAKLGNKKIFLGQSVFLPDGITLFVSIDFGENAEYSVTLTNIFSSNNFVLGWSSLGKCLIFGYLPNIQFLEEYSVLCQIFDNINRWKFLQTKFSQLLGRKKFDVPNSKTVWIQTQRPIVSLPLLPAFAREFDEALIEAQVVSDRVLPSLRLEVLVVCKLRLYEVIDVAELQLSILTLLYAHCDHSNVTEWRLHIGI